jgi:hypothetical protein
VILQGWGVAMTGGTVLMARIIVGAVAVVASAGCAPGAKLLSNEQTRRDATTWEDALRAQIDLDVAAIIAGMISVHRPRGASLQSEP